MCQSLHTDSRFAASAQKASALLHNFIGRLNTNVDVYKAILKARADPDFASLPPEYKQFAAQMQKEFEQYGIHLKDEERHEMVQQADNIKRLEHQFLEEAATRNVSQFELPASSLASLPPHIKRLLPRVRASKPGNVVVDTSPELERAILQWTDNEHARRTMYENALKEPKSKVPVLEALLSARHGFAELLKHESYAHLRLAEHIAGKPDTVASFLNGLASKIKPKLLEERKILMDTYAQLNVSPRPTHVQPWDKDFLTHVVKAGKQLFGTVDLSDYLSLENCLEGLSILSSELFGLKLNRVTAEKGELWAPNVIKMEVLHEKDGPVGTIYLDLFARPSKLVSTANYALRFAHRDRSTTNKYHKPAVVLVCSFNGESLSLTEVEALFHEYGHCLHTLLSRTEFQHHAGTRGPMDWVETPSTLMETFATDYRVLERFAFHHSTGKPLPIQLLNEYHASQSLFSASTVLDSILLSMIDQRFHGPHPPTGGSSTALLAAAQLELTGVPLHANTYAHGNFTHLACGYAASYYSYLYCRAFSSGLWRKLFMANPLSRTAGETYRKCILQPGGSGDPLSMLTAALGEVPSLDAFAAEIIQPSSKYMYSSK